MSIFTDNADFYPTPKEVIEQMMMGENIVGKTVLEPSAGKGDIVDWLKESGAARVIACEKDTEHPQVARRQVWDYRQRLSDRDIRTGKPYWLYCNEPTF